MTGLKQLSPQTWVTKDAPPFLMIHGTADSLVPFDQSEKMCATMQTVGADCEVFAVPGGGHGMGFWEVTAYKTKMMSWLKDRLSLQ